MARVTLLVCCLFFIFPVVHAAEDFPQNLLNEKLEAAVKNKAELDSISALLDKGAQSPAALREAIAQDRSVALEKMLKALPEPLDTDAANEYLTSAIRQEKWEAAYTLLAYEPEFKVSTNNMFRAAASGNDYLFQRLLPKSSQPLQEVITNSPEACTLRDAVLGQNPIIVKQFLQAGSRPDGKCTDILIYAARAGDHEIVELLLEAGASVQEDIYPD